MFFYYIREVSMSKIKIADTAIIVIEGFLVAGLYSFLSPCPVGEHIMGCHWVSNVSVALSSAIAILALLKLLSRDVLFRRGINSAVLLVSLIQAFVPGWLIAICAHEHMRCHVYTQPAVVTVAGIVALITIGELVLDRKPSGI
jgi:hypothetical protein